MTLPLIPSSPLPQPLRTAAIQPALLLWPPYDEVNATPLAMTEEEAQPTYTLEEWWEVADHTIMRCGAIAR